MGQGERTESALPMAPPQRAWQQSVSPGTSLAPAAWVSRLRRGVGAFHALSGTTRSRAANHRAGPARLWLVGGAPGDHGHGRSGRLGGPAPRRARNPARSRRRPLDGVSGRPGAGAPSPQPRGESGPGRPHHGRADDPRLAIPGGSPPRLPRAVGLQAHGAADVRPDGRAPVRADLGEDAGRRPAPGDQRRHGPVPGGERRARCDHPSRRRPSVGGAAAAGGIPGRRGRRARRSVQPRWGIHPDPARLPGRDGGRGRALGPSGPTGAGRRNGPSSQSGRRCRPGRTDATARGS
jgi:hypothetical protein